MVDYNTLGNPTEIAAAKKLAGAHAETLCVPPGTEMVWTPDGVKQLITGDEKPLWTFFVDYVKTALNLPPYVAPVAPRPVVPTPTPQNPAA